jgi:E3 ubiquitin-protein ligase RNF115/126
MREDHDHNPWDDVDTGFHEFDNGSGWARRSYRSQDGRFSFTSTTYSVPGRRLRLPRDPHPMEDPFPPMLHTSLDTIFRSLTDSYLNEGHREAGRRDRSPWSTENGSIDSGDPIRDRLPSVTEGLSPRDANGPQPMSLPLGNMHEYVFFSGCSCLASLPFLQSLLHSQCVKAVSRLRSVILGVIVN